MGVDEVKHKDVEGEVEGFSGDADGKNGPLLAVVPEPRVYTDLCCRSIAEPVKGGTGDGETSCNERCFSTSCCCHSNALE